MLRPTIIVILFYSIIAFKLKFIIQYCPIDPSYRHGLQTNLFIITSECSGSYQTGPEQTHQLVYLTIIFKV